MKNIPIYSSELIIADKICNNRSFAYTSIIERCDTKIKLSDNITEKIKARETDFDLYYYKSILVSTVLNRNEDYFMPEHVWVARHTPEDKPVNYGHDDSKTIGHMTNNWVIDREGNLVDDNTPIDKIPDSFHVITSGV